MHKNLVLLAGVFALVFGCSKADHSSHGEALATEGRGAGVITKVLEDGHYLMIKHEPIEAIGMGAMTMGFEVIDGAQVDGLASGDSIAFDVRVEGDRYLISGICMTGASSAECRDSDQHAGH